MLLYLLNVSLLGFINCTLNKVFHLQREEQMRREMERHDRERRKEEERMMREKQREEVRVQREQRRALERKEKFLQKETRRVSISTV